MAAESLSGPEFWVGDWLVQPSLARIVRGDETVHVTPRAMEVLVYLVEARGRVVSRNDVLDAVWPGMVVTPDALSQCIVELRRAFRDDSTRASIIETIPRIGIRLIAPVSHDEAPALAEIARSQRPPIVARMVRFAASPVVAAMATIVAVLGMWRSRLRNGPSVPGETRWWVPISAG